MATIDIILFSLILFTAFIVGLLVGWDQDGYDQGVNDGYEYAMNPIDNRFNRAARILRGKPLPLTRGDCE